MQDPDVGSTYLFHDFYTLLNVAIKHASKKRVSTILQAGASPNGAGRFEGDDESEYEFYESEDGEDDEADNNETGNIP
ncbi:hypothetical protein PSPO01_14302 [Paraphaeosphaeria sporulosa]